jgi:small-conductance mechanosensitive channel
MLRDHSGRLRVPVGVAYGSDTELVRDLLLQVANEHSDVIKGNSIIADPNVFFMAFGDSSLDFELRCYIYNIDNRRVTISDLNFAIDKIFRINNISIPFPQRDIHILKQPKDTDFDSDR